MTIFARFGLLAGLYLSQGLPYGFFTQALPVLLRQQGASLPDIGLANLLALPWMLKFLWAPVVDGRAHGRWGRRRGVILPLQVATVLVMVALSFHRPEHGMTALLVGVLVCNLLAATQDIATDALAIDLLQPEERGHGNGVQVAAYRVGMILGGGAILMVLDQLGWHLSFVLMATVLALATVPIALWREPVVASSEHVSVDWRSLGVWFQRGDTVRWIGLLFVYKLGDALATGMVRPMMVDAGLGLKDVGLIMGTMGSVMGLLGALLGGWGAQALGRRCALLLFGLLQACSVAGYTLVAHAPSWWGFAALASCEQLFGGMATVALFTAMMDVVRPTHAAADYTLQACVVVASTGIGASLSGLVAARAGYEGLFVGSACLCLAAVAAVASYRPQSGEFLPCLEREAS